MADEYEVKEDQHSIHQDQEDIAVSPQQSNKDAVLEVIPSTSTEVDVRRKQKHYNNYLFTNKEEFASRAPYFAYVSR